MDKLYYAKLANFSTCFQFNFHMTKDVDCERNMGSLYISHYSSMQRKYYRARRRIRLTVEEDSQRLYGVGYPQHFGPLALSQFQKIPVIFFFAIKTFGHREILGG